MNILYTAAIEILRGVNKGYSTSPRLGAMDRSSCHNANRGNTFKSLANQKELEEFVRKLSNFYLFRSKATPGGV
jgi:hypothetical protein